MKIQFMKAKSIEDSAVIIHNIPQLTGKETDDNIPDGKIPVSISINEESWKVWEKLSNGLRDNFAD
jgi:hypothetical protein